MDSLALIDWIIIAGFLLISLLIGLRYRGQASGSLSDFFLGGRNLPWYIAGISMVATTFAADTPLFVAEVIAKQGISGNWLWWNMLIGGMLTTFFFARLWRRANILTELEFLELRYQGPAARFLRGFKSVYMGLLLNAVIIGWVNAALIKILVVFFDISELHALYWTGGAMVLVAIYSSLSGLLGVVITDTLQFIIAMTGTIVLAVIIVNSDPIGGIEGLKSKLAHEQWRFDFFPQITSDTTVGEATGALGLTVLAFLSFVVVQWWASWFPGAEPGGGGYISQRMMSAKNEKHAVFSTLFFQIAHYCIRPWPWIIVGLCAVVLYPELPVEEAGKGFVMAMNDFLPAGLKGMLLVAFLGAYMSTISTQLNWGASYITNDLYKRFIRPSESFGSEAKAQKHYVSMARWFTIAIMLVSFAITTQITAIEEAVNFLIACGAGLGAVLILRWYWWRINAWSELAATIAPFFGYTIAQFWIADVVGPAWSDNRGTIYFTAAFTTVVWLVVTYLTNPEKEEHLIAFYKRVRPSGSWTPIRVAAGAEKESNNIGMLVLCWVSSVVMTYSILFAIGKLVFHEWELAAIWIAVALVGFAAMRVGLKKTGILRD